MQRTKIPWATHVWNPVTGCSRISEGCEHCYAAAMSKRFGWPWGKPVFHPERLNDPLKLKNPARIFVCSMGDLFHEDVETWMLDRVFDRVYADECNHHTFIILTKRPRRMATYLAGWDAREKENVWLGVSVENQARADERIPILLSIPVAVRWVSYEPALGPLIFRGRHWFDANKDRAMGGLSWLIAGPETGPGARPCKPEWIQSVADQCQAAGVAFFDKSNPPLRREYPQPGEGRSA